MTTELLERAHTYTRKGRGNKPESKYEKPVILPEIDDEDPLEHAWADARFATDIMAEHGLFFALLMPEELASREKREALEFSDEFTKLHQSIDKTNNIEKTDLNRFIKTVTEPMKRFIDYKQKQGDAQRSGKLRSMVWPLFFDHTRHEAERWTRRLDAIKSGDAAYERKEVATFWNNIMDEHARFVAHLLDPDELELIEKAENTSNVFRALNGGGLVGEIKATLSEPGTVVDSLIENPEVDAVMSAAETILDFKTKTARDIEKARIKSIIDPRLADHVRREALKFVDELRRAV